MVDWLSIATAGLWGEVWKYGLGGALIVGCLAAAWFSPVFKKEFLWGAAVIGAFMIAFAIGVSAGEKRVQAKWDAAVKVAVSKGKKARAGAVADVRRAGPGRVRSDRFDRDHN